MAKHHGKNGKIKVSTNQVAEVTAWTITETVGVSDTTAMGDAAQTHLTDIPGWTAQVTAHFDPADTNGQNALTIGASVTIGVYSDGDASGKTYFTGTASVTNIGRSGALTGAVAFTADLTGNGALSRQVVSP